MTETPDADPAPATAAEIPPGADEDVAAFRMEEHAVEDNRVRLVLVGELDIDGAPQLAAAITDLAGAGRRIFVDLRQLQFIDSSGLRVLIQALTTSRQEGFALEIGTELTPQVRDLFELVEVGPFLWPAH